MGDVSFAASISLLYCAPILAAGLVGLGALAASSALGHLHGGGGYGHGNQGYSVHTTSYGGHGGYDDSHGYSSSSHHRKDAKYDDYYNDDDDYSYGDKPDRYRLSRESKDEDDYYYDEYPASPRGPTFMDSLRQLTRPLYNAMYQSSNSYLEPSRRTRRSADYPKKYRGKKDGREEERMLRTIQSNDDGKCGQRLVCELSAVRRPLTYTERQILSFIWNGDEIFERMVPGEGVTRFSSALTDYRAAAQFGKRGGDCGRRFRHCNVNASTMMQVITGLGKSTKF